MRMNLILAIIAAASIGASSATAIAGASAVEPDLSATVACKQRFVVRARAGLADSASAVWQDGTSLTQRHLRTRDGLRDDEIVSIVVDTPDSGFVGTVRVGTASTSIDSRSANSCYGPFSPDVGPIPAAYMYESAAAYSGRLGSFYPGVVSVRWHEPYDRAAIDSLLVARKLSVVGRQRLNENHDYFYLWVRDDNLTNGYVLREIQALQALPFVASATASMAYSLP